MSTKRNSFGALTLKTLRAEGFIAQVVEHRIPYANRMIDLFGGIDIVAVDGAHEERSTIRGVLGVQTCRTRDQATRMKKILAEPRLKTWVAAGNLLEVWGWAKKKVKRGGKAAKWEVTRRAVKFGMFPESFPAAVDTAEAGD